MYSSCFRRKGKKGGWICRHYDFCVFLTKKKFDNTLTSKIKHSNTNTGKDRLIRIRTVRGFATNTDGIGRNWNWRETSAFTSPYRDFLIFAFAEKKTKKSAPSIFFTPCAEPFLERPSLFLHALIPRRGLGSRQITTRSIQSFAAASLLNEIS